MFSKDQEFTCAMIDSHPGHYALPRRKLTKFNGVDQLKTDKMYLVSLTSLLETIIHSEKKGTETDHPEVGTQ